MSGPVHVDLPEDEYPFRIEFFSVYDRADANVLHTIDVDGPGVVEIPSLSVQYGVPIRVKITYANGTAGEHRPPSA